MKNKERYIKEIIEIVCKDGIFGVDKHTGRPVLCRDLRCGKCLLDEMNGSNCNDSRHEWSESEYVELPVISKRDRAFLDYIDSDLKYIVRDKSGILYVYDYISHKVKNMWISDSGTINTLIRFCVRFPMIKWEDEEPWLIEDLKKLEVVDSYGTD